MIRLVKRKSPSRPGFSENIWLNLMTRETATGRKLNRKKKRVRRAFRPCRKKTVKTRPTEFRKERKLADGRGRNALSGHSPLPRADPPAPAGRRNGPKPCGDAFR